MAMLIKSRARKALELAFINASWAPHGVGGMPTNEACVSLSIGNHKLIVTESEWKNLVESQEKLMKER